MKVTVEATQDEFDAKRPELLKALAKRGQPTVYDQEKPAIEPRRAALHAQNEMMDYWTSRYRAMVESMKGEISDVLKEA